MNEVGTILTLGGAAIGAVALREAYGISTDPGAVVFANIDVGHEVNSGIDGRAGAPEVN